MMSDEPELPGESQPRAVGFKSQKRRRGSIAVLDLTVLLLTLTCTARRVDALAYSPPEQHLSRRDALIGAAAATSLVAAFPQPAQSAPEAAETVDLAAINAARSKAAIAPPAGTPGIKTITASKDPTPLLSIRGGRNGKSTVKIPRAGFSLYKTATDQAARCTSLALRAGVRHIDVATAYGSNSEIAKPLKRYLDVGISGLDILGPEKPELLELLGATSSTSDQHALSTVSGGTFRSAVAPPPDGSAGRRGRREGLFLSHKVSNSEQSADGTAVRRAVKAAIATLGASYLDMVSIHSPLTDPSKRLGTYAALLDLRDSGFIRSVGVCNYGLGPLKEIEEAGLDLPAVNQLELSPFNSHGDVVSWCDGNGVAIGCAAWSKLSGVDGPEEGWATLAFLAKKKGMTKAQVLVRWSLQKGYVCVPRSGSASKVERVAIAENSYGGVNPTGGGFVLSEEEMRILDDLDVGYRAGRLGRRDGWDDGDVAGLDWEPTEFV